MDGQGAQPCYHFCMEEVHDDLYSVCPLLIEALKNHHILRGFQFFHPGAKKVDILLRGMMGRVKMIKYNDRLSHNFVDLTHHLSLPECSPLLLYRLAHHLVLQT